MTAPAPSEEQVEAVARAIGGVRQDGASDYGLRQRLSWDEQVRAARAAITAYENSRVPDVGWREAVDVQARKLRQRLLDKGAISTVGYRGAVEPFIYTLLAAIAAQPRPNQ